MKENIEYYMAVQYSKVIYIRHDSQMRNRISFPPIDKLITFIDYKESKAYRPPPKNYYLIPQT